MPRRSTAKSATTVVATDEVATTPNVVVDKNIEVKDSVEVSKKSLIDSEEVEIISIVPHVTYVDGKTGDVYEWEEIGHSEYMTVETLKNMWRNHKGYFRNLLLKPLDERVVEKFGLKSTYKNYEFLMDESSYTRQNIGDLCKLISDTSNGLKYSICNKIKNMVSDGLITDISVIRSLEKQLDIDLISLL